MAARPRYAELADELRRDILAGAWKPGELLPTELELASTRKLSRSTVRAALAQLVDHGLIRRQPGIGTRVCRPSSESIYDASISSMEELLHFGQATQRQIRSIQTCIVDEEQAEQLTLRPGSRWILLETIRTAPESPELPICKTEIFFDPRYQSVLGDLEDYSGLLSELLRLKTGVEIDAVDQVIRPTIMAEADAIALLTRPCMPALEIMRRYISAGRTIYVTRSTHPGDRYDYRMTLRRNKAGAP